MCHFKVNINGWHYVLTNESEGFFKIFACISSLIRSTQKTQNIMSSIKYIIGQYTYKWVYPRILSNNLYIKYYNNSELIILKNIIVLYHFDGIINISDKYFSVFAEKAVVIKLSNTCWEYHHWINRPKPVFLLCLLSYISLFSLFFKHCIYVHVYTQIAILCAIYNILYQWIWYTIVQYNVINK